MFLRDRLVIVVLGSILFSLNFGVSMFLTLSVFLLILLDYHPSPGSMRLQLDPSTSSNNQEKNENTSHTEQQGQQQHLIPEQL